MTQTENFILSLVVIVSQFVAKQTKDIGKIRTLLVDSGVSVVFADMAIQAVGVVMEQLQQGNSPENVQSYLEKIGIRTNFAAAIVQKVCGFIVSTNAMLLTIRFAISKLRIGIQFEQIYNMLSDDKFFTGRPGLMLTLIERITAQMCNGVTKEQIQELLERDGLSIILSKEIVDIIHEEERADPFLHIAQKKLFAYKDMPGRNIIVHTPCGPMVINRHDRVIGKAILEQGRCDVDQTDLLRKGLLAMQGAWPRTVIVDVGANVGSMCRDFARLPLPNVEVHSFEAQYAVFLLLASNVAINNLHNVVIHHRAVSTTTGKIIRFPSANHNSRLHSGGFSITEWQEPNDSPNNHVADVPMEETLTLRIDDLNLTDVRLIKVDVEGMEESVLIGARQTITRCRPLLCVEVWKTGSAAIRSVLALLNYQFYWASSLDILAVPEEYQWRPDLKQA